MNNDIFYNIGADLEKNPDCAVFIVLGGRSTGKTYSTLKYCYERGEKFVFVKRTNADIKLLAARTIGKHSAGDSFDFDLSPFKSINADTGSNVKAFRIRDGLGGFWNCGDDGEPVGGPVGYILSLNAINKFKGFDLSDCNYIIFDEFIPLQYERVDRNEGLALMDLYRTVGRANNIKHGTVLKLICLANSTTVSCPVLNELELSDVLIDMKKNNESARKLDERAIFIRLVPDINGFREQEAKNPIYKAMAGTQWARMSLENDFAYNDFSNVSRQTLKRTRCILHVKHKQKDYYIYAGEDYYYMTYTKSNKAVLEYDLNRENDQKRFYLDECLDLRNRCIDGQMKFETYEMYDLIINYKDFYKV